MARPTLHRLAAAAALVAALGGPARAGDATGAFAPYEDVVEVIADLTWHLDDDVYRFPRPRDPTGHDLYQLALHRLEHWEKRYPGKLREVTTFARAEALERLGEYAQATELYRKVTPPSPLAPRAAAAAARSLTFAAAAALPETAPDLDGTLTTIKKKLDAWGKLVDAQQGQPIQALALVEEERLEARAAALVVEHRRVLPDGTGAAERALRFLIEKHAESRNLPAHVLRLADLYADVARDYVAAHDRPLAFDEAAFTTQVDRALETYRKVATWDGAREKPEGQGRYGALDAWKADVLARYR
jgi:tetratricopeptide (TPR) repeat protein